MNVQNEQYVDLNNDLHDILVKRLLVKSFIMNELFMKDGLMLNEGLVKTLIRRGNVVEKLLMRKGLKCKSLVHVFLSTELLLNRGLQDLLA